MSPLCLNIFILADQFFGCYLLRNDTPKNTRLFSNCLVLFILDVGNNTSESESAKHADVRNTTEPASVSSSPESKTEETCERLRGHSPNNITFIKCESYNLTRILDAHLDKVISERKIPYYSCKTCGKLHR